MLGTLSLVQRHFESAVSFSPIAESAAAHNLSLSEPMVMATASPAYLVLGLGGLLLSGCLFIALEIRAEYRDD